MKTVKKIVILALMSMFYKALREIFFKKTYKQLGFKILSAQRIDVLKRLLFNDLVEFQKKKFYLEGASFEAVYLFIRYIYLYSSSSTRENGRCISRYN